MSCHVMVAIHVADYLYPPKQNQNINIYYKNYYLTGINDLQQIELQVWLIKPNL